MFRAIAAKSLTFVLGFAVLALLQHYFPSAASGFWLIVVNLVLLMGASISRFKQSGMLWLGISVCLAAIVYCVAFLISMLYDGSAPFYLIFAWDLAILFPTMWTDHALSSSATKVKIRGER